MEEQLLENYENFNELTDEWDGEDEEPQQRVFTNQELGELKEESNKLKEFFNLARSIKLNSKGESLLTALKKGFAEAEKFGAYRKALIFTESTRTQKYLFDLLQQSEFRDKLVLFNGSNTDELSRKIYELWLQKHRGTDRITGSKTADIRSALIEYFRDEAEIMIATEAAAEGVNLQFCSLVVNYDLPWNPQRIEQRIGRCHRYGQKFDVVVVNFLNKSNAADQRVYQILSEKFKLFEGVFGASDEVLGNIESGVDFEKRIATIYQNCRTKEEIDAAFDELQKSLNDEIDSTLKSTRQKLLENFDEEVTEKLKLNLSLSKEYLSKYEDWLWKLTRYFLNGYAEFDETELSFYLNKNPFESERIFPGPYRISKIASDENIYRIGHPLAQRIIEKCKALETPSKYLKFNYSSAPVKISVIEPLIGCKGVLSVYAITISAFDIEDYIVHIGYTEEGKELSENQCKRLFSLSAEFDNSDLVTVHESIKSKIENSLQLQRNIIVDSINRRNGRFFEEELDKLDKWGEDKRNSLKITLKDLDDEIKELKKQARLAPNLPEKLTLEKGRKKLEVTRDEAWREYDSAAKEIETLKDKLIDDIEMKMQQEISMQEIFLIEWAVN
jgi:hypothetical protein